MPCLSRARDLKLSHAWPKRRPDVQMSLAHGGRRLPIYDTVRYQTLSSTKIARVSARLSRVGLYANLERSIEAVATDPSLTRAPNGHCGYRKLSMPSQLPCRGA